MLGAFDIGSGTNYNHATAWSIAQTLINVCSFDWLSTIAARLVVINYSRMSVHCTFDRSSSVLYAFNFRSCFASLLCQLSIITLRQDGFPWHQSVFVSFRFIFSYQKTELKSHVHLFWLRDRLSLKLKGGNQSGHVHRLRRQWHNNLPTLSLYQYQKSLLLPEKSLMPFY